jgi:hypothetical protein
MKGARLAGAFTGVALAAASAFAGGAAAASAAQADVSTNWAGYVASAADQVDAAAGFSDVSGTWVQPGAKCGSVAATGSATSSAFWVGLGGNSDVSDALEQVGTESDCTASGAARYSAWYELVPATSVRIKLEVAAGDRLSAAVSVEGTSVAVTLKNLTSGKSFSKQLHMAVPDTGSAEWIAEAPSLCASTDVCRQAALTNFGKVTFSQASATSNGHTGTISDSAWSASPIELDALSGGPGFGRFQSEATAAQALPGNLAANGAAFTVKWSSQPAQVPSGPGYGGGGGYPGYPYGR